MARETIVLAFAGTYLIACLVIGSRAAGKTSDDAAGYVAGDRAMGGLVMYFITGAMIFSAFAFLGAPGRALTTGGAVFFILGYGTIGFLPFYWLGPRAARLGREYGFVTQAELVAHRFKRPALALIMALISLVAFVPYLSLQIRGAGHVVAQMSGGRVSVELGAAIVYAVVLVYVARSGVLGVGWTNTFQGIFMLVLAWTLGWYVPKLLYGGIGPMFERLATEKPGFVVPPGLKGGEPWSWLGYSSEVLVLAIGFSFWPHLFMKAYTARNDRVLQRTVVLYPTFQLFLVPLMIIGFAGVLYESAPAKADQILPFLLMDLNVSSWVVGLFCAGALAASMSSGDAILHAAASILVRDGWVRGMRRELSPSQERRIIRILLLPILVLGYLGAVLVYEDLVGLLVFAYGPVGQFAPPVVAALCWRRATGAGAVSGLVAGVLVTLLFSRWPEWRPLAIHAGAYGLVVNCALLVFVSLATRAPDAETDEFLRVAREGSTTSA